MLKPMSEPKPKLLTHSCWAIVNEVITIASCAGVVLILIEGSMGADIITVATFLGEDGLFVAIFLVAFFVFFSLSYPYKR